VANAATLISLRRTAPVVAFAMAVPARVAAARVRLKAITAGTNQALLAASDAEGRCASAEFFRSAWTCSMIAWCRWGLVRGVRAPESAVATIADRVAGAHPALSRLAVFAAADGCTGYAVSRIQRHGAAVADRANESTSGVICMQVPKVFDRSLPGRSALPARLPVLGIGCGTVTCRSPWRETWGRIWC